MHVLIFRHQMYVIIHNPDISNIAICKLNVAQLVRFPVVEPAHWVRVLDSALVLDSRIYLALAILSVVSDIPVDSEAPRHSPDQSA